MVCSIEYSSTNKFVQMIPLGWPWPILRQGQIWSPMLLYGKTLKQWDFFRNDCSIWYKSWQSTKWVHKALWVSQVKVIHWPWSKSLRVNIFKLLFLNNRWFLTFLQYSGERINDPLVLKYHTNTHVPERDVDYSLVLQHLSRLVEQKNTWD